VRDIALDLTQTQLAEKINAKQKSISRYETGASLPSIKTPVKIAKVLKKPAVIFWKSKAKKPKRINLHKSIDVQRKDERPIYDSFRSIFECFKA